jgi:dipeptidyl aminopeptidase/acylaminoacyl peptidase
MRKPFFALVLLLTPALLWARVDQDTQTQTVDDVLHTLASVRGFSQTAISPDGTRVAWVENRNRDHRGTSIMVADVNAPSQQRRITAAPEGAAYENQLAWSPDSKQIAFLSDAAQAGQQQLYLADVATGKTRKLTDLRGFVSNPGFSPDGQSIAILFIENSPRAAGPLQPMTPPSGVMEENIYEQRINLVDLRTGKVRPLSPADTYIYEYDWAPDSQSFVVSAARGDGDNNWWIAQLFTLGLDGQLHSVYKPKFQIANPRISPDGKTVAFIEGLMSDQGVTGGDVFAVPLAGGDARNLTPGMLASASWLTWTGAGQVLFAELIDGNSGIAVVDMGGKPQQIWTGPELISAGTWETSISVSREGKQSAVVRSSALHPPELWVGPVGAWEQFTSLNRAIMPLWGEQRSVHWTSDKLRVQGWLLLPRNYDARKRYSLLVHVHGGPASACTAGWPGSAIAPFAAVGHFVLCPNPRGSYGQGEAFTQANVKDFGGGDFRDIMAGVDEVLRENPIDPKRLGIGGWSYGGYMTMWAETQTNRFAAAIAGAGLSDWLSYYGQNDIDQWMIPYFGASVYDDPAVYAKSDPIRFVKNVRTPTLILVGDRDGECPAPQSFEWWHALKTLNVPVQFVVYPGEGHLIQQPDHRRDQVIRSVQWYDRWLK